MRSRIVFRVVPNKWEGKGSIKRGSKFGSKSATIGETKDSLRLFSVDTRGSRPFAQWVILLYGGTQALTYFTARRIRELQQETEMK